MAPKWITSLSLLVGAVLVGAILGTVGGNVSKSLANEEDPAAYPAGEVHFQAKVMEHKLRIATGEVIECVGTDECAEETDFRVNVESLLLNCNRIEPGSLVDLKGFDEAQHGEVAGALTRACDHLEEGRSTLGEPRLNPGWEAIARSAIDELAPLPAMPTTDAHSNQED